jgi:hypothetical protein
LSNSTKMPGMNRMIRRIPLKVLTHLRSQR